MAKIARALALHCALLSFVAAVSAEEIRDYYAEPGINQFKETVNQHFNEHVDPFSGTLQLKYTDLSIPGNGGMDINVARVYTSLQTNEYPTLALNGLGWVMHFGRIVISKNHVDKLCNQGAYPLTTLENPSLELPDGGRELLVLNHINNDNTLITRSNWRAQCIGGTPGMLVTSPDGTKYTMSQFDNFQGEPSWLTTRIEDLQGNWIRIDYQVNAAGISYINAIYRSEEGDSAPVVQYEYESPSTHDIKLSAIVANGQRVEYHYEAIPGFTYPFYKQLVEVVRPDGRSWHYGYNPKLSDPDPNDGILEDGLASYSLIHVEYPHGASIDYTYQHVEFDPGSPQRTTAIHTKQVAGTGVTGGQWTYAFAPHSYPYTDSLGGQLHYDVTTITGPEDILKFYHYGKDYRATAGGGNVFIRPAFVGIPAFQEVYSSTNVLLQRTGFSWTVRQISNEDFMHGANYRSWWRDNGTYVPVLTAEYANRDSHTANAGYSHYKQYFDHDVYGNPGRVLESSNLSDSPATQRLLTYFIDPTKWILHLVDDETIQEIAVGGPQTVGQIERAFDANGKLLREAVLGVETEYTYTPAGDVASVEDARGNLRTYSNYKRGIAQLEQHPQSVTIRREVNDAGTVGEQTNARGYTTRFQYDELNRITSIDFPIKSDVTIGYGIVAGGYRRSLVRGNYLQAETINDFGQVLRVERSDALTGQMIYSTKQYDALGRETFSSYPNDAVGVATTYDALGRVRKKEHPDQNTVEYVYDDSSVTVRNEREYETQYLYRVRGLDFARQQVAFIHAPQEVGTIVHVNSFDNKTLVFQGEVLGDGSVRGYGKQYEYDAQQVLVRAIEPEVGTAVFTHDPLGNVLSEQVNEEQAVFFIYDNLNQRTRVDYPGTTLDVTTTYDGNSNVRETVKGTTHWVYDYDENDNLTSEALSIDDPLLGTRTYVTARAYDSKDVLQQITYPSGLVVDYAPDAFGRPSRAGSFATNVTYHPSGQLQDYQLANGVVTNITLNQRLFTQRIQAGGLVDLGYSYDEGGNVTAIDDQIEPDKSMPWALYDELDRLSDAEGSWGYSQFTYDHFGNIRTKSVGDETLSSIFDDQRRLRSVDISNLSDPSLNGPLRMEFDTRGNTISKRRFAYALDGTLNQTVHHTQLVYELDSSLTKAKVTQLTVGQASGIAEKDYLYDGNGQRSVETKPRTYDIRYSVHAGAGDLLFEDSIADCVRTDYIRLGALLLARSDDRHADPTLDSDGDAINDCMESQLGLNPNNPADAGMDADGDGLSNRDELLAGTALNASDTDHDGLTDAQEMLQYLTDPTLSDSDGDGLGDATEVLDPRTDPLHADKDHDGVSDYWELQLASNPEDPSDGRTDTDGDGFSNRQESLLGFDPTSSVKVPGRGRQAWSFETLGEVQSSAALGADGTLYVSAYNDNLYAINADGTERWFYSVPGSTLSAPTVAPDGTVYFVANGATQAVYAINPDGSERWVYFASRFISGGVVLDEDGLVYFSEYSSNWQGGQWVYQGAWEALNAEGQRVTEATFSGYVNYPPVVAANGNVHVVDGSGLIRAYTPQGAPLWTLQLPSWTVDAPTASADRLYFAGGAGHTFAVSFDGQLLWARQSPDQVTTSTVTIGNDGVLYLGAYDSKLYAVNPVDGSTLWEAETYGTSYTPAIASDGTIYVTTFGGSISAFSPSGSLLWIHKTGTEVSAPPVIDRDGTLYFGSRSGQVFAVADNGGGLANTPWPMSRHDIAGSSHVCFNSAAYSFDVDTDGDSINDCAEIKYGLDPSDPGDAALDSDGDGLTNTEEYALGTSLSEVDTDGDGLEDGDEVLTYHTNPINADSDEDSIQDGQELTYGWNPLDSADALLDADGDGFSNRQEGWAGTDPISSSSTPTLGTRVQVLTDNTLALQSPAVAADGTIYQLRAEVGLEALNPNLTVKWTWRHPILRLPVVGADGTIYVVTHPDDFDPESEQRLVALYPNGQERWSYRHPPGESVSFYGAPVLGNDGTLFIGLWTGEPSGSRILAFDKHGRKKWGDGVEFFGMTPDLSVDRDGNLIAFKSAVGVRAYRAVDGALLWQNTVAADGFPSDPSPPVIDADGTIYVKTYFGLYALHGSDGTLAWQHSGANGPPVITPTGLILQYCGTQYIFSDRHLCAISRQGTLVWQLSSGGTFYGVPVVGANGVILAPNAQGLVAFDSNGTQLWNAPNDVPGRSIYPFTLLDDGTIYVTGDRYRNLIIGNVRGLANSPWPALHRDNRNSHNALGIVDVPLSPSPTVAITDPLPWTPVDLGPGDPIEISAYAVDAADGNLSSSIVWTSSRDGVLGTGPSLSSLNLSSGSHLLTASVADSSGLTSVDSITVNLAMSLISQSSKSDVAVLLGSKQGGSPERGPILSVAKRPVATGLRE